MNLQQPSRCFKGMPGFRTPVVSGKQFDMNKRVECQSKKIETKFIIKQSLNRFQCKLHLLLCKDLRFHISNNSRFPVKKDNYVHLRE